MQINKISNTLRQSVVKLSEADTTDQQELKQVIAFGIKAIGTLEALVDTVMQPLKKAKASLYKIDDPEITRSFLVEIITEMYEELEEAQDMVFKFQSLTASFDTQIAPILSKYLTTEEVYEWAGLFDLTSGVRSLAFARVESLLPKIEEFLNVRFESSGYPDQELKMPEVKAYINEVINEMRNTKKELQLVKAGFLQLSGWKGLVGKSEQVSKPEESDQKDIFDKIKKAVSQSRIEKALDLLEGICNQDYPDFLKEVILLQSQYYKAKRDFYTGIDNDKVMQNRINYAILTILEEMEKI